MAKKIKKTIYTLNIDGYAPEITEITYPLMKAYAHKIGADFHVIDKRRITDDKRFPTVEKLQIFELGRQHDNDWNIYIDSDTLINPDFMDVTNFIAKDTVMHNGNDIANNRWRYDHYFMRDGRHIGSCNWFTIGSDWCLDLWRPLDDMTIEEALENIFPVVGEKRGGCNREHLIDDYIVSRNIARFGLKFTTATKEVAAAGYAHVKDNRGNPFNPFLWHIYNVSKEEKIARMREALKGWGLI